MDLSRLNARLRKLRPAKNPPPVISYKGLQVPFTGAHAIKQIRQQLNADDYENPEISAARALIQPGDRVLEMGTGLGIVSALVSRTQPGVTVESYEGNASLIPHIDQLHRMNEITAVKVTNAVVVSGPAGSRTFFIHKSFAEGSLHETPHMLGSVTVPAFSFREVVARFRPDILLCDIEGGEADLFHDIDLSGLRAVIIELHPKVISRQDVKRIYDLCAAANLYPRIELSSAQVVAFERVI